MIFGGSPINVAVPPIFDDRISDIKKGIGLVSKVFVTTKVTGTSNKTVVTLSKSAEKVNVISENTTSKVIGLPFESLAALIATYSKTPVRFVMLTIIIIDTSRPIVLKSTLAKASAWLINPKSNIKEAPHKAATTLLSFSLIINE
ncbi:hypothetical protein CBC_A0200 [Clostridium botulinum C str. Eklund]|nr:hypothetical protein CBC_A0200 [Clostridium botulinum C str. Eklund]